VAELERIARSLRSEVLTMISEAKSGHPGGSLSALDIILELHLNEMNYDITNPRSEDRDRFVLSKGHAVPALYAVLAQLGFIAKEKLHTLRHLGSPLQGHPANRLLDCIEASTGSLGQGLSVALGLALAARIGRKEARYSVFALLGDGELQEGQVWEALMAAAHYRVNNLVAFIDRNKGQIDGLVDKVMTIEPLKDRFLSFGWAVQAIDGHDFLAIHNAVKKARAEKDKPSVIIAETVKGKGVSFLEKDTLAWHGRALAMDELKQALLELRD
jgi:transketolase